MDRTEGETRADREGEGALMDKANPPSLASHKSDPTRQGGKTGHRVRSTTWGGGQIEGKKDGKRGT